MISLRASWRLAVILVLAHGAAFAMTVLAGIPLWMQLAAAAGLTISLVFVVRRHALLLAADSAVAIEFGGDNKLNVRARRGEWTEYAVLGTTYVAPYLTVLNLRRSDSRAGRRVALLPDSLDAEEFRKLRVWLRWNEGREIA